MSTAQQPRNTASRVGRPLMPVEKATKGERLAIDPMATRFGWSALHAIDIRHLAGRVFPGKYREYFGPGEDDWREAIPARSIIEIVAQKAFANRELPAAAISSYEEAMATRIMDAHEMNMLSDNAKLKQNVTSVRIVPATIAFTLMSQNEKSGMCLFEEVARAGLDYEALAYFMTLLFPPDDPMLKKGARDVSEYRIPQFGETIFLYQYRDYLRANNRTSLVKKAKSPADQILFGHIYDEVSRAVTRGWSYANATLNSSEANIKKFQKGHKGKENYDEADARFPDAPPPRDLLFLAETNRTPLELAGVHEANILADRSQVSVVEGMREVGREIANSVASAVKPQTPAVTLAEINQMFAAKEAEWERRSQEAIKAARDEWERESSLDKQPAVSSAE